MLSDVIDDYAPIKERKLRAEKNPAFMNGDLRRPIYRNISKTLNPFELG